MVSVSTASVLLAAKMEESFRPNFLNIIDHLDDEQKKFASRDKVQKLEAEILVRLCFEFNISDPI